MRNGRGKSNPFKGAYPLEIGDPLFGRERDLSELFQLLVAQRILLLHAPSGAGKTSLVQAGLIPQLEQEGFRVLPVARMLHEPVEMPAGSAGFNRYSYSLLHSLEHKEPCGDEVLSEKELASLSLREYLDAVLVAEEPRQPTVLIVDQFEEVFKDPLDSGAKKAFFYQLGRALRNPYLWALFVIRDDYMGVLRDQKYLRPIPTQLGNSYHLDLLDVDAAGRAIQGTAAVGGRRFTETALSALLKDLCQIRVKRRDGVPQEEEGTYVEPVQLQVVCEQLWEKLPADTDVITVAELGQYGDVDDSLGDFYEQTVAHVALANRASERSIRNWFERDLITTNDLRTQVMDDGNLPLDDQIIQDLIDSHLVRGEDRRGITWYELAHDRLVRPVQERNRIWYEKNLSLLQRRAEVWRRTPDNDLLLQGEQVWEAERWAKGRQLKDYEEGFLKASVARERARRKMRWRRRAAVGVIVILLIFTTVQWWRADRATAEAREARATAEEQRRIAEEQRDFAEEQRDEASAARVDLLVAEYEAVRHKAWADTDVRVAEYFGGVAESLRLADRAGSYLEAGEVEAALLVGREAIKARETEPAIRLVRDSLIQIGYESPPVARSLLLGQVCRQVGRNMKMDEWRETFERVPYRKTCALPGAHVSYAEAALLACDDISEARRRYEQTGLSLAFNRWAAPHLLRQAVRERDRDRASACLQRAHEVGVSFADEPAFLATKASLSRLAQDFSSQESALDILRELEDRDAQRSRWLPLVAAAFDQPFYRLYRDLCANLDSLEDARRACGAANGLLAQNEALSPNVPLMRTVSTSGTKRNYTFDGSFGDTISVNIEVIGAEATGDDKPAITIRNADEVVSQSRPSEGEPPPNLVVDRTDSYFVEVAWEREPPPHRVMIVRAEPRSLAVGSAVDAPASARLWRLEASEEDVVTIAMDAGERGDPLLQLRDGQGKVLAVNDDFGSSRNARIQKTLTPGTEYFVDAGWYQGGIPVPYRLTVSRVGTLELPAVEEARAEQLDWVFAGQAGTYVTISMTVADGDGTPSLRLLDGDQQLIEAVDGGEGGEAMLTAVRLPYDGDYFLHTAGAGERGSYRLSVEREDPQELTIGDPPITDVREEQRYWVFKGVAGDIVDIAVEARDEESVPVLRIKDVSGEMIGAVERGTGPVAQLAGVRLPADGEYLLETGWIVNPGAYSLSLMPAQLETLEYGETLPSVDPGRLLWRFEGYQGDFIAVEMEALTAEAVPELTMEDVNGTVFDADQRGSGVEASLAMPLPADGSYLLNTGWVGDPAPYSLSLTKREPLTVTMGARIEGTSSGQSLWQFAGSRGDFVSIALEAAERDNGPPLTLYDAGGKMVETDESAGSEGSTVLHLILPADDTYVVDAGWVEQPFSYTLSLQQVQAGRLSLPADFEAESSQWAWQFEGEEGEYVRIAMEAMEEGVPLLRLYDGSGRLVAEDADLNERNALLELSLPESGSYFVDAGWLADPGRYRLVLRRFAPDVDAEPLASAAIESALLLIERGEVEAGLGLLEPLAELGPSVPATLLSAAEYNQVCRYGSLWGFAAEVMFACERAVILAPENAEIVAGRGVARALTGNFEGAVTDLRAYIELGGEDSAVYNEWITQLEAGRNPFEEEVLRELLRNE